MEYYIELEKQVNIDRASGKKTEFCDHINFSSNSIIQLKQICNDFVNLVNNAKTEYSYRPLSERSKYPNFLNYWINYKISAIPNYTEIKKGFFEYMKSNSKSFDPINELKVKIQEIDNTNIQSMKQIYDLYKDYLDLKSKDTGGRNSSITVFKDKYNEALVKCFTGGEYKFCKALENLKKFRENIRSSANTLSYMLPTLPELIVSEEPPNKVSQIAKIGTNLIRDSIITSSDGLYMMQKDEHSNLKNLISLQYNLRMEKNDDEKYCVMMKILLEFFQYCKRNKHNSHLLSFIKEFIEVYYKKKKGVYDKIFADCLSNNPKSYCEQYKKCNQEFEEDITLIHSGTEEYINNKEEYFKNLAPDDSWIGKAIAIFQDSEAMSKNSPTIMSTLVSIILIVFFLYKLSPLSSIFRKEKKKKKIPFFFPERRMQNVNDNNTSNMNAKPKRGKIRFSYQPS